MRWLIALVAHTYTRIAHAAASICINMQQEAPVAFSGQAGYIFGTPTLAPPVFLCVFLCFFVFLIRQCVFNDFGLKHFKTTLKSLKYTRQFAKNTTH